MLVSRRAALNTLVAGGVGTVIGGAAYGLAYSRHQIQVFRGTVPVSGLSPVLEGLRIGLITDTHHSAYTSLAFIQRAVALLQHESPDLVVLGGDYVTLRQRAYVSDAAAPFAALRAPEGVFGVLGNHDEAAGVSRVLRAAGVSVLRDARTRLRIRGETVDLLGVDYWTRRPDEIAPLARGRAPFTILLAHDPRRLWEAAALRIPLVLSGHTHGGQVSLPIVGPVAAQKFPVAAGIRIEDETTLFVSRGVGTVLIPCRIGCPPEVALLTLRSMRA